MRKVLFLFIAISIYKLASTIGINSGNDIVLVQLLAWITCLIAGTAIGAFGKTKAPLAPVTILLTIGVALSIKQVLSYGFRAATVLLVFNACLLVLSYTKWFIYLKREVDRSLTLGGSVKLLIAAIANLQIVKIASTELQVLRFAVRPTNGIVIPDGARAFSPSVAIGPLMIAFIVIALLEALLLHGLQAVLHSHVLGAFAIISDISVVYFVGIARSIKSLPTYINGGAVHIRTGLLFDICLDANEMEFESTTARYGRGSGVLNGALLAAPNSIVRFPERTIEMAFGIKKTVSGVKLALDSPSQFWEAVDHLKPLQDMPISPSTITTPSGSVPARLRTPAAFAAG